jgi:hypothetical protein
MDVRETSVKAYEEIKHTLPETYRVICDVIARAYSEPTAREIDSNALAIFGRSIKSHKRMQELIRQDLVEECGERECNVSGRTAIIYRLTGRPRKIAKRAAPKKLLVGVMKTQIETLEGDIKQLRNALSYLCELMERPGRICCETDTIGARRVLKDTDRRIDVEE